MWLTFLIFFLIDKLSSESQKYSAEEYSQKCFQGMQIRCLVFLFWLFLQSDHLGLDSQATNQDRSQDTKQTSSFAQTDYFKEHQAIRHPKYITVLLSKDVCFCFLVWVWVVVWVWFFVVFFFPQLDCKNRFFWGKNLKCPIKNIQLSTLHNKGFLFQLLVRFPLKAFVFITLIDKGFHMSAALSWITICSGLFCTLLRLALTNRSCYSSCIRRHN